MNSASYTAISVVVGDDCYNVYFTYTDMCFCFYDSS